MRRRDKAGGKPIKTQRHKTLGRHNALKVGRKPPAADANEKIELLERRLNEALEQQAATSEVLGVISSSPGELGPVFEAILENATRICGGRLANLFLYSKHEHAFRLAAQRNAPAAYAERWAKNPVLRIGENPRNPLARLAKTKRVVAIPDLMVEPGYINREPRFVALVEAAGARTHVLIPMLKEGELIGGIAVYRQEVLPFTDRQIELLRNFAAQAVIAIENTRLLNELRQRTDDLSEALEQQTATSEVLQVISSSPGELEPVFNAMLDNAVRLCEAKFGNLFLYDGEAFRTAAIHNLPRALAEERRRAELIEPIPDDPLGRLAATKQKVHIPDARTEMAYKSGFAPFVALVDDGGCRTLLVMPLLREDELIGAFAIYRQEVNPFTDKQIELVQNFASQAVIAIENTRLLSELRESLQQQTATADVLKVISSSPGQLEPVFQAMLENATHICEARFGNLLLYENENDAFRMAAMHGAPPEFAEKRRREPIIHPSPKNPLFRVAKTRQLLHIIDLKIDEAYVDGDLPTRAVVELAGTRTIVVVPMLKDDKLIGAIGIYRQEVRPFTDKQIELLKNFAAQAVIAIENTRLLSELRESLQQQTATADVLKIISSSPGQLEPVFEAMLANAVRICGAKFGTLFLCEGGDFRVVAQHNTPPALAELRQREPILRVGPGTSLYRSRETKQAVQIADLTAEPAYFERDQNRVALVELGGYRAVLSVPMLKDDEVIGAINMYRQDAGVFLDKQVELVKNFAAQAVIAIENTRLLNELRQSLEQQTATADVLKVISSSPGDLEPVFQSMLVKAVQICEAKFGVLFRCYHDSEFHAVAWVGVTPEYEESLRERQSFRPDADAPLGRLLLTKELVHTADELAEKSGSPAAKYGGARSLIAVPMRKQNELVGALVIYRTEVRPFTEKQIELVRNFAAQAVIAIENARLLNDLNKLNQQLEQRVADQVSEIERTGRLRRFLPPQVADLIVASGSDKQLESHRREITALFCDLRGFTGFSESSDPEDVMALLGEYHAAIGEIINKYGGTLERYAGDGVMVVFNDPIPVDNPALQAVLMAIDMRAAIGELIEKWRKLGHDIGFGIGIAHGFATLGTIGFEGRFDYAAIGTVSNVASRLCDEAKPGQILISPRVLMAVEKDITVEPVGDFALKGIRRPLTAYNVLAAKSAN